MAYVIIPADRRSVGRCDAGQAVSNERNERESMNAQIQLAPIVVVRMSVQDCQELHAMAKTLNQEVPIVKRLVEVTEGVLKELTPVSMEELVNGRSGQAGGTGRPDEEGKDTRSGIGFTGQPGVHPEAPAREAAGYL